MRGCFVLFAWQMLLVCVVNWMLPVVCYLLLLCDACCVLVECRCVVLSAIGCVLLIGLCWFGVDCCL